MRLLGKTAIVIGVAGAMALGAVTTSQARGGHRWGAAAAGFAAGAVVGAAAANTAYYNGGYGYYGGYDLYAYAPGYAYDAPGVAYTGDPSYNNGYGYGSYGYGYNSNYTGPMRERALEGHDN